MRYIRLGFALCCAFVGFEFSPANAEKRVALVIGNTAYEHTRQLPNARHDAHAVAMLLATSRRKIRWH